MAKRKEPLPAFSQQDKQEWTDRICDEMVEKRWSLSRVLREGKGYPSYSSVQRWRHESEAIETQLARARSDTLEALIEEMIETAANEKLDHNSRRVRIIAIEKAAMMLAPRKFGAKLDITSGGEKLPASNAHERIDRIEGLLVLAARRARAQIEAPMIDVTPEEDDFDPMS
jgi:hypothetical protein